MPRIDRDSSHRDEPDDLRKPTPCPHPGPIPRPILRRVAGIEGLIIGALLAVVDIHSADPQDRIVLAYFVAGLSLGFRHERRAGQCWLPLGFTLYGIHLLAIAHGYKQPYVERNSDQAMGCLWMLVPAGSGLFFGGISSFFLAELGWIRRPK